MSGPFKMKGFSGFGNSPTKQGVSLNPAMNMPYEKKGQSRKIGPAEKPSDVTPFYPKGNVKKYREQKEYVREGDESYD